MNLNDDNNNNAVKRRRIASPPHHDTIGIFDIPDGALVHVTSYLSKPSVALLALSLTCESASWKKIKWNEWNKKVSPILAWAKVTKREPSSATRVIVSSHTWESLDYIEFGGVLGETGVTCSHRRMLCEKLKDDDVAGVLACINARTHLRTLGISGCKSITGRGLRPLSGSLVLEQVDLRHKMVDYPVIEEYSTALSEVFVLPVLESIINTPGNMLTLVHFPEQWREAQSPELNTFLVGYNRLLEGRRNPCSKCNTVGNHDNWVNHEDGDIMFADKYWGMQNFICHQCVKFFCYECNNGGDDPSHQMLCTCKECKGEYCDDCFPMTRCAECNAYVCNACSRECPHCEGRACRDCEYIQYCDTCSVRSCDECTTFHTCEGGCGIMQCNSCVHNGVMHEDPLELCEVCENYYCSDCRYDYLRKDWGSACRGCIELVSGVLGKKLHEEKQADIAENLKLKQEVEALRSEARNLRQANEELKAKVSTAISVLHTT